MRALLVAALVLVGCKSEPAPPAPAPTPTTVVADDPWAAPPKPRPAPTAEQPFAQPALWSATKDGKRMWLFGTLHVGVDVTRRLPLWIWKRFTAATLLVQEVDLHAYAQSRWATPPSADRSLRAQLGESYWAKLERAVTPVGALGLDKAQIWTAHTAVSGYGGRVPDPAAVPMDGDFLVRAKEQGKPQLFLETVDAHGAMFSTLYDVSGLYVLLDNLDALARVNRRFFDEYIAGDLDALYTSSHAALSLGAVPERVPQLLDGLLYARNRAWVPQLEAAHAQQPTDGVFVTVGVLHMLGPDNLRELLEKRGFTIARVTAE